MTDEKQRLFVDMDGTLAVFKKADMLETLYEEGYFLNLQPHENLVAAVREIALNNPSIEVHILSAYLTDSKYALAEKNEWLDRHLPEIDQAHRIFVPCGSDKKDGIEGGVRENDFLLDDYTKNLNDWQPPARGIKLLNGINHTQGTWEHDRIRFDRTPEALAAGIVGVMKHNVLLMDEPLKSPKIAQVTIEDLGVGQVYSDERHIFFYNSELVILKVLDPDENGAVMLKTEHGEIRADDLVACINGGDMILQPENYYYRSHRSLPKHKYPYGIDVPSCYVRIPDGTERPRLAVLLEAAQERAEELNSTLLKSKDHSRHEPER